ncbi:putative L-PSP endoribonuclease family protein [Ilyonectria destructans]|nr:putative L-PSP endoribonuclease family protein [Ilyonectria destructans]
MATNGTPYFLPHSMAQGRANYPHARIVPAVGSTLYISGTSSRKGDGTHEGVTENADGTITCDIRTQTAAVLRNIGTTIGGATNGKASLANIVDATVFLTDMADCFEGMNDEWNKVWPNRATAPARTTVEVSALPHPRLLVEIKCTVFVRD